MAPVPHVPAGVVRERVGDILVQGESGAQILVDPELVEHFEATLTKVGCSGGDSRGLGLSPPTPLPFCPGATRHPPRRRRDAWQVRTVPVTTSAVPLEDLRVPVPRVDELSSVEASLRVDAIASAGVGVGGWWVVNDLAAGARRLWVATRRAGISHPDAFCASAAAAPLSPQSVPTSVVSSPSLSLFSFLSRARSGFRMSRSKMGDMIKAGDVRVNCERRCLAAVARGRWRWPCVHDGLSVRCLRARRSDCGARASVPAQGERRPKRAWSSRRETS